MRRTSRVDQAGRWAVGIVAALLVGGMPLVVLLWLADEPPELRVVPTGERLSTLIVDGHARILVIDSDDREATIEASGVLARPWEPKPSVLVAPADDDAAVGLWEALQRTDPGQVIVAGLAGSDPQWAAIDEECRTRGIEIRYVAGSVQLATPRLAITVFGPLEDGSGGSGVVVRRGDTNVLLALGPEAPDVDAQVAVGATVPKVGGLAVLVAFEPVDASGDLRQILASSGRLVHVKLEQDRVRIDGGTLLEQTAEED